MGGEPLEVGVELLDLDTGAAADPHGRQDPGGDEPLHGALADAEDRCGGGVAEQTCALLDELDELERALATRARRGQQATPMADLPETRHAQVMARGIRP